MIQISALSPADRPAWTALFRAYNTFYERILPEEQFERAWQGLQEDTRIHALGARMDDRLVGIVHFLVHPSTTAPDVCYLQDLFTAAEARGKGVGRALIEAVGNWAGERGCSRVYWHTQESNHTARLLYDKIAENRGFIQYVLPL